MFIDIDINKTMHVFALMELTNILNLLFTQNISSEHLFSACQEANLNYLHKPVFLKGSFHHEKATGKESRFEYK